MLCHEITGIFVVIAISLISIIRSLFKGLAFIKLTTPMTACSTWCFSGSIIFAAITEEGAITIYSLCYFCNLSSESIFLNLVNITIPPLVTLANFSTRLCFLLRKFFTVYRNILILVHLSFRVSQKKKKVIHDFIIEMDSSKCYSLRHVRNICFQPTLKQTAYTVQFFLFVSSNLQQCFLCIFQQYLLRKECILVCFHGFPYVILTIFTVSGRTSISVCGFFIFAIELETFKEASKNSS